MSKLFSRRRVIGAGGAVALSPLALARTASADVSGPLVVLTTPVRLFDSRVVAAPLNGAKLASGGAVVVTAGGFGESGIVTAVFINLTITATEGSGFLRVEGDDLSGERPPAATSNINWSGANQTLANMVLTTVGGENGIAVTAGGGGRTHVIVDVMGYIPFVA